ncbi:MAG TPA: hypothetical protein VFL82_13630 [Thermomicrobiales bacterium]|nr:hypothetical protein [Thermomicrobiales bacterium]
MRTRLIGLAICSFMLMALVAVAGPGHSVKAQESATPAATAATPAAQPAQEQQIVTLVGWYTRDESGNFLRIGPLTSNENLVAAAGNATDRTLTGKIDFDADSNDGLPQVQIGESTLDAYPVVEGDPDSTVRWTYFNDDSSLRPSTLVMQVEATAGPYKGAVGTVTLISRSDDGSGVMVVVLNLP